MKERLVTKGISRRLLAAVLSLGLILGLCPGIGAKVKADGETVELSGQWNDLQSAFSEGGSYKLMNDFEADIYSEDSELAVAEGKSVTIDLNGHTIDRGLSGAEKGAENGTVMYIPATSFLTIEDSSEGKTGLITGGNTTGITEGKLLGGAISSDGGSLTINGGTIKGNKGQIGIIYNSVNGPKFSMNGGEISGNTVNEGAVVFVRSSFYMYGGVIRDNSCTEGQSKSFAFEMTGKYDTTFKFSGGVISSAGAVFHFEGEPAISLNKEENVAVYVDKNEDGKAARIVGIDEFGKGLFQENYKYIKASPYKYIVSDWSELYGALESVSANNYDILLRGDCVWDPEKNKADVPLRIREGQTVVIDLNGYVIDRNLQEDEENGYVIKVEKGAELHVADSRTDSSHLGEYSYKSPIDSSEVSLNGGIITGGYNKANGGAIFNEGSFILDGGVVFNNKTSTGEFTFGGGVYNAGTFIMNGGALIFNQSDYGGGFASVDEGTVEINDGQIINNVAILGGGGYLNDSNLYMDFGDIDANLASEYGGGVFCSASDDSVKFTFDCGEVSENVANEIGGGIYAMGGDLEINDLLIAYNKAYGVFVEEDTKVTITSGDPLIYRNTANGKDGNLYVSKDVVLNVSGLEEGKIGVTSEYNNLPYEFTSGGSFEDDEAAQALFFSDNEAYGIAATENKQACIYELSVFTEDDFDVNSTTYVYDGEEHSIGVSAKSETAEGAEFTYAYSEDGTQPDEDEFEADNPGFKNAGTYTVYFKASKSGYKPYVGYGTVTIGKKDVGLEWAETDEFMYDGAAHYPEASFTEGSVLEGDKVEPVVKAYQNDKEADPINVGEYTAKVTGLAGDDAGNYNIPVSEDKDFEITPGEIIYKAKGEEDTYDPDCSLAIDVIVTTPGNALITYAQGDDDVTVPSDDKFDTEEIWFKNIGTYYVWFKIEADNYQTVTDCRTVIVKPKNTKVTAEGYEGEYDGDLHSINVTVTKPSNPGSYSISYAEGDDDETEPAADEFAANKPSFKDAGTYYVWYRVEATDYTTVTGVKTVVINPKEVELEWFDEDEESWTSESSYTYDGAEHQITAKVKASSIVGKDSVSISGYDGNKAAKAGNYTAKAKSLSNPNYTLPEEEKDRSESWDINPKTIEIEWSGYDPDKPFIYDGSVQAPVATVNSQSLIEGDTIELEFKTYPEDSQISAVSVFPGIYVIYVTGIKKNDCSGNYKLPDAGLSYRFYINKKKLKVTAKSASKFYGDDDPVFEYDVDGLIEADIPENVFQGKLGRESGDNVGEHDITVGTLGLQRSAAKCYDFGTGDFTGAVFSINPRTLTYTWSEEDEYEYDGNAKYPEASFVTGAVIGEDKVEPVVKAYQSDEEADPVNVGEYTAKVTGLTGADAGNYALPEDGVDKTYNIIPADIDFTVLNYEGDYDGNEHGISIVVTDPEDATVTYAEGEDEETEPAADKYTSVNPGFKDAGTYYVWFKIEKDNYSTVTGVAIVEINKKEVAVKWYSDEECTKEWTADDYFTYDGKQHGPYAKVNPDSLIGEDECGVVIFGKSSEVNDPENPHKASVARLIGGAAKNYRIPEEADDRTQEYNIKPKEIAFTWSGYDPEKPFVYNGKEQLPTATVDKDSLVGEETIELGVEAFQNVKGVVGDIASDSINAGDYLARVTGIKEDTQGYYKHYIIPEASDSFEYTILKKKVSVTAEDEEKIYGDADPALEYEVDGLLEGVDPEGIFTGKLEREAGDDVDEYEISQGTLAINQEKNPVNYELDEDDFTGATFTVKPRELSIKWSDLTLVYNGENRLPSAEATNLVESDEGKVVLEVGLDEGQDASRNVGEYFARVTEITGDRGDNYTLPSEVISQFTVIPCEVEAEWSDTEFTYDKKSHVPTAKVVEGSLYEGDTCEVVVSGERTDAGKYTAKVEKLTNENYVIKKGSATETTKFVIKKAKQTITVKGLKDNTITISGGTTYDIDAKASAGGALSYKVKSGDDVISVDDVGVITALKKGNGVVTITAGETRNYAEATKDINVKVTSTIYTVTFNANGHGKAPEAQKVAAGKKAKKPEDPKATGYALYGWFTDKACKTEYNWNSPVNSNIVLYAKWVRVIDMYRLYNPNSGEHFYTASSAERNELRSAGWKYEGVAWRAPENSKTPVYRVYNPNAGDHHYTISSKEKDQLVAAGWKDEGIGWYSDDAKTVPIYRVYNPNAKAGAHHFTMSKDEVANLVKAGWKDEGIAWYGK